MVKKIKDNTKIKTYLIGIIAIVASWMISTLQMIMEKVGINLYQLGLVMFFEINLFFLLISFWHEPNQIKGKFNENSMLFCGGMTVSLVLLESLLVNIQIVAQSGAIIFLLLTISCFWVTLNKDRKNSKTFIYSNMIMRFSGIALFILFYFFTMYLLFFKHLP